MTPNSVPGQPAVSLRTRIGGYLVDMVIFAAIAMVITAVCGALFLAAVDGGTDDADDWMFYTALLVIGLGTPLVWSVISMFLLVSRGQTAGQYVAGLKLTREDGGKLTLKTAAAWWFFLNPLLFSWPMLLATAVPLLFILFISLQYVAYFATVVLLVLFVLSPIVALVSALLDGEDRALHDRVAGVVVVSAD